MLAKGVSWRSSTMANICLAYKAAKGGERAYNNQIINIICDKFDSVGSSMV